MKQILTKGKISTLVSDSGECGWSGEAHVVKYKGKKYMLRKAMNLKRAKKYETISKKLASANVLPKFLGRSRENVLYEYIGGRDLDKNESLSVIKQIGAIAAHINRIKSNDKSEEERFKRMVREATTGVFKNYKSYRPFLKQNKIKPLLSKQKSEKIRKLYLYLKKKVKPAIRLDINDSNPSNFRLRKGKVYFVDIEAIKPRIKSFCIGKAFIKWFKKPKEQKAFLEGYNSVSSTKFLTEEYIDFIYLIFLVQEINYACKYGKEYKPRQKARLELLDEILKKYGDKKWK